MDRHVDLLFLVNLASASGNVRYRCRSLTSVRLRFELRENHCATMRRWPLATLQRLIRWSRASVDNVQKMISRCCFHFVRIVWEKWRGVIRRKQQMGNQKIGKLLGSKLDGKFGWHYCGKWPTNEHIRATWLKNEWRMGKNLRIPRAKIMRKQQLLTDRFLN